MADQSSSLNNNSGSSFADVLKTGLAGAASAFTAYETANTVKKAASPTTIAIIGGGALLVVIILVVALKK